MSNVLVGPGLLAENQRLKNLLKEVKYDLKFPYDVAIKATNGKTMYEGDDYWFILNALEKIFDKIERKDQR